MTAWAALAAAIACEVAATLSLRMASLGTRRLWYAPVVAGYGAAFALLAVTLQAGMPLGMAYGIWAACGVALTAVGSWALFGEPLTRTMIAGIGLIGAGVLIVEIGASA